MGDEIRIGGEPPPAPPPRSGKAIGLLASLVLLVAAAAWLMGTFRQPASPTTTIPHPPGETTSTEAGTTTAAALADRLRRAGAFWTAMGAGDAAGAAAVVAEPDPAAGDLIAFVAAFSPGLTVEECRVFAADTVECLVTVTDEDLLAVGIGTAGERLLVSDDGRFDVPSVIASSAARLSLYALNLRTEEVRAACPLTDSPRAAGLAIVGSPTADCGAYLAGLIPEYLGVGRAAATTP